MLQQTGLRAPLHVKARGDAPSARRQLGISAGPGPTFAQLLAELGADAEQLGATAAGGKRLPAERLSMDCGPLAAILSAPLAARQLDAVARFWPIAHLSAGQPPAEPPFCALLPAGACGAWHAAHTCGGAAWWHCMDGAVSVALAPPSSRNLALMAAGNAAPTAVSAAGGLDVLFEDCEQAQLQPGDTLFIPSGGWPGCHAGARPPLSRFISVESRCRLVAAQPADAMLLCAKLDRRNRR